MKPKWVIGIDYSITCPAITLARTDKPFSFANCQLRYLSEGVPKAFLDIIGTRLTNYSSNEERFDKISTWAIESIQTCVDGHVAVFIEDYSYNSKHLAFSIAENTGLLKYKLFRAGLTFIPVPPLVIKKLARGKGRGDKDEMYAAFVAETGIELMPVFQPKANKVGSPTGDIVDSFYICKYGHQNS